MSEEGPSLGMSPQPDDTGGGGGGRMLLTSRPIPLPRKSDAGAHESSSNALLKNKSRLITNASDSEEGFLSTSPDSANGEPLPPPPLKTNAATTTPTTMTAKMTTTATMTTGNTKLATSTAASATAVAAATATAAQAGAAASAAAAAGIVEETDVAVPLGKLYNCTNSEKCVTLRNILSSFKAPLSEEQAWAVIHQLTLLYRNCAGVGSKHVFNVLEIPEGFDNVNLHPDGSVHFSWSNAERKELEQKMHAERLQRQRQHDDDNDNDNDDDDEEAQNVEDTCALMVASHKKILRKIAVIVYSALDYNLPTDEQCQMSPDLEELIANMTTEENDDDCIDEGIDEGFKRWDEESEEYKCLETKEFDCVLEACRNHVKPTVPEDHYKAVCRALVTETIELRIFLQQVLNDGADNLHLKADSQTSKQELAKLGFTDWARFWVQVIDELRRGVRLKKNNYERAPIEYELTPYEILMEDIRSKKYQLRKVMVNGDIPPRVKKDAHALILEFIRSRPPLKKASERKLPPPIQCQPSPREQLMDSIRKGQPLKHIPSPTLPRRKDRLLPQSATTTTTTLCTQTTGLMLTTSIKPLTGRTDMEPHKTPRTSKQRLIKVDLSLLQDDDHVFDETFGANSSYHHASHSGMGICSQPQMPPYPIGGYMTGDCNAMPISAMAAVTASAQARGSAAAAATTSKAPTAHIPATLTNRVLRRTTYDLATQCESRRASQRRHTIVGCQSNFDEAHSMPASRPSSRQSDAHTHVAMDGVSAMKQHHNNYNQKQQQKQQQLLKDGTQSLHRGRGGKESALLDPSGQPLSMGPWNKSFFDERTWKERGEDHLSLTLDEIVHIRSVITKAQLEGLPVGVRVREDVEKRKVCFLCLRTRFWIFGPWGIQCKLCQRTVCSKCSTKMRIPSEHFRNVPLVLISPSLLASPAGSNTPSPSHHAHHQHSSSTGNILDDTFPKSLIERLLRSESEQKTRHLVGSAPNSPRHQRSNMSTPGVMVTDTAGHAAAAAGQAVEALHANSAMTASYTAGTAGASYHAPAIANGSHKGSALAQANNRHISLMSRSMEGPRSLPANSPARTHSNSSTLDRKAKFSRAFLLSSSGSHLNQDTKENVRGELVPVCNDCKGLVMEITRSSKHRSSARNRALKNMTLDLSPVYK